MMMVVTGAMIGGRPVVMELIAHVVMVGVVIGIMLGGIQRNVREHHVLMVVLADHGVLQVSDYAGGSGLGEHEQQGNAKRCPNLS